MKYFILIDPALPKPFLRLSSEDGIVNQFLYSSSSSFWNDLNNLIQQSGESIQSITFFINFGPGSYTGLKQSKILAEVFKEFGSPVYVFQQYHILNAEMMKLKYFFSSAYKGQYFLAEIDKENTVQHKLLDIIDWQNWFKNHSEESKQMMTIDEKFSLENNCTSIVEIYSEINFKKMEQISSKYKDQPITYYRAVSDDYYVSISR